MLVHYLRLHFLVAIGRLKLGLPFLQIGVMYFVGVSWYAAVLIV